MIYTLHLTIRNRLASGRPDDPIQYSGTPMRFQTFPDLDSDAFDGVRPGADLIGDSGLPNGEWVAAWWVEDHAREEIKCFTRFTSAGSGSTWVRIYEAPGVAEGIEILRRSGASLKAFPRFTASNGCSYP